MFEEYTEDYFMEQARLMGEKLGVDTRQGSVYMDAAIGHCIRTAKFYNDLSTMYEMLCIDTCTGDVLEEKANSKHLYRKKATSSYYSANFEGVSVAEIVGDRFMAGNYYFVLTEYDGGFYLCSELVGSKTNYLEDGMPLIPVRNIMGLSSASIGNLYMAGTDDETDEELRARLKQVAANPPENGNKQHYKIWCESFEGVGRAVIIPKAYGNNTVKALIIGSDGNAPTQALIDDIQQYVDPGHEGLGEGVGNIGCCFYAVPAVENTIDISMNVILEDGYTMEAVEVQAKDNLSEYLKNITLSTADGECIVVQYVKIVGILANTPGIKDFSNLLLNSEISNIEISGDGIPVLGEVNINVGF